MYAKNNNGRDLDGFVDIILAFMLTVTIAKSSFYPFTEFCLGFFPASTDGLQLIKAEFGVGHCFE